MSNATDDSKLPSGPLESISLWYGYKTQVWLDKSSPKTAAIHNIMRTLRAFSNYKDGLAYLSVPITSGLALFNLMKAGGHTDPKICIKDAMWENYNQGEAFLRDLQKRLPRPILFPADLVPIHQKWEHGDFQSLWLSIIGELCTEVHMSRGWEFSNGCSEEFVHSIQLQLGIPSHPELAFWNTKEGEAGSRKRMKALAVYDHKGNPIGLDDGIRHIEYSVSVIEPKFGPPEKLKRCLELLHKTRKLISEGFYQ